jgi:SAM-dependent methyltransferase
MQRFWNLLNLRARQFRRERDAANAALAAVRHERDILEFQRNQLEAERDEANSKLNSLSQRLPMFGEGPPMKIHTISDLAGYRRYLSEDHDAYRRHLDFLQSLKPQSERAFSSLGYSYTAAREVEFISDFQYSNGFPDVNWRERVVCPVTQLNNRCRAAIHIFDLHSNTFQSSRIYLMEQTTDLYVYLRKNYSELIGSEFLGSTVPLGDMDARGLRNEDATCLSFEDESLDAILSFDVFEHIPNYRQAFRECYRTLRSGASMFFTVPFNANTESNTVRAIQREDGEIEHILPPEYHGDPLSDRGILCYRHFGWEMLAELRGTGFTDAYAYIFKSAAMGYYTTQVVFHCRK